MPSLLLSRDFFLPSLLSFSLSLFCSFLSSFRNTSTIFRVLVKIKLSFVRCPSFSPSPSSSPSLYLSVLPSPFSFLLRCKVSFNWVDIDRCNEKSCRGYSYGRQLRPRRTICRSFLFLRCSDKCSDRSSNFSDSFIDAITPRRLFAPR